MKKVIVVILLVSLIFLFCGCESVNSSISDWFKDKGSVELGQYKGLVIKSEDFETIVTDLDVDDYIKSLMQQNYTGTEVTDRPVKTGDTVNISFVGLLDGVAFEGGSSDSYNLVIGSGNFIDGFEDGLVGANKGDEVSLDLKFPDEYHNADLAGKPVVFNVVVKAIYDNTIPELTDELAQSIFNVSTADELKSQVRVLLESSNQISNSNAKADLLWRMVLETSTVERYPKDSLKLYKEYMASKYESAAKNSGLELEVYIENNYGMTSDEFDAITDEYAKQQVKQHVIARAIAKEEGFSLSETEYKEGVEYFLALNGYSSDEEFISERGMSIEEYFGKEIIEDSLLLNKAMDFVAENAIVE